MGGRLIDRLGGANYVSTLDLAKGYYQVPVRVQDHDKTAFISPQGKYWFKMMPFGFKGAPTTFQCLMDQLLDGLDFAFAFIDDIAVCSKTWEEHLATVFGRLAAANLTLKPRKCQLCWDSVGYLGHIVGHGRVKPEQAKVTAVQTFQVPKIKTDARAFLGLAGYYQRFIPNFGGMSACLSDLTKAAAPAQVEWTEECDRAFQQLKDALTQEPVLVTPDYSKPFVPPDRCLRAGTCLSQKEMTGLSPSFQKIAPSRNQLRRRRWHSLEHCSNYKCIFWTIVP
jgi:hypothetical protein